uniref:Uncharacterized protein n=1 Tax=Manihot esculenta TaxID=3983 RepID=A0A2C9W3I6_MANES
MKCGFFMGIAKLIASPLNPRWLFVHIYSRLRPERLSIKAGDRESSARSIPTTSTSRAHTRSSCLHLSRLLI